MKRGATYNDLWRILIHFSGDEVTLFFNLWRLHEARRKEAGVLLLLQGLRLI